MFGLGMGEIAIILVLALILLGPQKLPEAAKQLGKGLRDFRKATEDLKHQFETELYAPEKGAAPKPTLVEPAKPSADAAAPAAVPSGGVPAAAGEVPPARADNVPGLEAALADAGQAQPVTTMPAPMRPGAVPASAAPPKAS